jgi:hypothetical protein
LAAVPEDVADPETKAELAEAERALDEGDYSDAVRKSAAIYLRLIRANPDLIIQLPSFGDLPIAGRGPLPARGPWPDLLGVVLRFGDYGTPELVFEKDRFTLSEAITYYEYTVDAAKRAERAD